MRAYLTPLAYSHYFERAEAFYVFGVSMMHHGFVAHVLRPLAASEMSWRSCVQEKGHAFTSKPCRYLVGSYLGTVKTAPTSYAFSSDIGRRLEEWVPFFKFTQVHGVSCLYCDTSTRPGFLEI